MKFEISDAELGMLMVEGTLDLGQVEQLQEDPVRFLQVQQSELMVRTRKHEKTLELNLELSAELKRVKTQLELLLAYHEQARDIINAFVTLREALDTIISGHELKNQAMVSTAVASLSSVVHEYLSELVDEPSE